MNEDTEVDQASIHIEPEEFIPEEKMDEFREDLRKVINKNSLEQYCNTPDFLLAEMLASSFENYCFTLTMTVRYVGEDRIYHMRNININNKES